MEHFTRHFLGPVVLRHPDFSYQSIQIMAPYVTVDYRDKTIHRYVQSMVILMDKTSFQKVYNIASAIESWLQEKTCLLRQQSVAICETDDNFHIIVSVFLPSDDEEIKAFLSEMKTGMMIFNFKSPVPPPKPKKRKRRNNTLSSSSGDKESTPSSSSSSSSAAEPPANKVRSGLPPSSANKVQSTKTTTSL